MTIIYENDEKIGGDDQVVDGKSQTFDFKDTTNCGDKQRLEQVQVVARK